jgi:hypothetical protein
MVNDTSDLIFVTLSSPHVKTEAMEIVFLLAGSVFVVIGLAIVYSEIKARRGTQRAIGKVIGYSTGPKRDRVTASFYSVAEYIGLDGRKRYIESSVGSSAPLHAVGDTVTILVNGEEPHKSVFQSTLSLIVGCVIASMGMACVLVFAITFQANTYSLIMAAAVLIATVVKLKSLRRKVPLSWTMWQEYKKQALGTKVFDEHAKDRIAWADPLMIAAAASQYKKSQRFAVPFLFAVGFGSLLLGHHFYVKTEGFLEKARRASGHVVELKEVESTDSDSSSTWAPVIEFNDDSNRRLRFVESISSNPPGYHRGQVVTILYNPENPNEARIDRGRANQWAAILLASVGSLFLLLAIFTLKRRMRA